MTKAKIKSRPILALCDDDVYILSSATGIHPLCLAIDGIPQVLFKDDKRVYMKLDTAIEWCEKELPHLQEDGKSRKHYSTVLDCLLKIRERAKRGEVVFTLEPKQTRKQTDN